MSGVVYWPAWKTGMRGYAREHGLQLPSGFNPSRNRCGSKCETLMRRIQQHAKIGVDGVMGPQTRHVLRHYIPGDVARRGVVYMARYGITINPAFHYDMIRPIPHEIRLGGPVTTDCSGSTTLFCELGGAPDPSGFRFDGAGNTSTMLAHLKRRTLAQARNADLVLFANPDHVAIILEHGTDPLLESHGFEGGPLAIRLSVERQFHAAIAAYLDLGV